VFFIVPDVFLSRIALTHRRAAFLACLWATAGAIVGGIVVWTLGNQDPEPIRSLFAEIPAINSDMIAAVNAQIVEYGAAAVFIGPAIGTPYKIYALESAGAGVGLLTFALISVPARLARFVLVTMLASAASRYLQKRLSLRTITVLHAVAWIAFYTVYFTLMSGA
jgi:membrane protein YqaA with SNARE-associated domain